MRQRRRRFTVTYTTKVFGTDTVRTREVLAYSADRLRVSLEARGYTNIKIEKTPNRKRDAAKMPREAKFVLDQAAVKQAIEELGITQPVVIRFDGRWGGTYGNHRFRTFLYSTKRDRAEIGDARTYHRIMLKSYLRPEQASRTLWHELAHAMQAEREVDDPSVIEAVGAWSKADLRSRRYKYSVRPCEVEAREYEAKHDELALARAVDKR